MYLTLNRSFGLTMSSKTAFVLEEFNLYYEEMNSAKKTSSRNR